MNTRRAFLKNCLGSALLAPWAGEGLLHAATDAAPIISSAKDNGYRGIWFTLGQKAQFGDKYSGGLGTYTANHVPIAIYAKEVDKTFFVYGGAKESKRHLLAMAAYYDHRKHQVPRPTIVHDKNGVDDPHDNPSLCLDGQGFLWVFVSGRAKLRPGIIYRSVKPYNTEAFEQIGQREFTYPQPRWIEGVGFVLLFTKYTNGRELYFSTSPDGRVWTPDQKFAGIGGHYQTSHLIGKRIITAFNRHPGGSADTRTNLYYLQTDDFGRTWRNVQGEAVKLPLSESNNPALVRDYLAEKQLIYIQDLDLDAQGHPVILFTSSNDFKPGPSGDPRWLTVARWTGKQWNYTQIIPANHNYSTGSIYFEKNDQWRIIGPTGKGPQPIGSGGEIAVWLSQDNAKTWTKQQEITRNSPINHNYVRRPFNAQPNFYAFWADGNPDTFSKSSLYFSNQVGDKVWRLPYDMDGEVAAPVEYK